MEKSEFRRTLFIEIIVTVIVVLLIEPILKLTWNSLLWISGNVYTGYIDSVYKNASFGDRNYVDVLLIGSLVIVGSAVLASMIWSPHIGSGPNRLRKAMSKLSLKAILLIKSVWTIIFFVSLLMFITIVYVDLQVNASFQQRITVLAPVITDQEYKELQAMWAGMDSRADYITINARLEQSASEHGIQLPKPLIK